MSNLGKIFIYEKKPEHLEQYKNHFETNGFFTFGTDNLYFLTQYTKELNPNIVIINLPNDIILNEQTLSELEEALCNTKSCPEIFINYQLPVQHKPQIHQWDFESEDLNYEQIMRIIRHLNKNNLN